MKIHIKVKKPGSRKELMLKQLYLSEGTVTLRDFIAYVVKQEVQQFIERQQQNSLYRYLTEPQLQAAVETGKVGFGHIANEKIPDAQEAVKRALLAFEDGLYRIFLGDKELTQLDNIIKLQEGDQLTFIRFTMLTGQLW